MKGPYFKLSTFLKGYADASAIVPSRFDTLYLEGTYTQYGPFFTLTRFGVLTAIGILEGEEGVENRAVRLGALQKMYKLELLPTDLLLRLTTGGPVADSLPVSGGDALEAEGTLDYAVLGSEIVRPPVLYSVGSAGTNWVTSFEISIHGGEYAAVVGNKHQSQVTSIPPTESKQSFSGTVYRDGDFVVFDAGTPGESFGMIESDQLLAYTIIPDFYLRIGRPFTGAITLTP